MRLQVGSPKTGDSGLPEVSFSLLGQEKEKIMPLPKGYRHSKETIEKIRALWKEPWYQEKQRKSHLGKKLSKETKKKLSLAKRGKPKPWLKGKPRPERIKKLLSIKFKGKGNPFWGKKHSKKTKKIISKIHTGLHHNLETKKKISQALKGSKSYRWNGGSRTYFALIARQIWIDYYKKQIPVGYVIHHKDENFKNNNINNLELMTRAKHISLHWKGKSRGVRS